ncbi:MAG: SGNH/GDSL hydrolase family protein [Chitinophagaceae bacterium]
MKIFFLIAAVFGFFTQGLALQPDPASLQLFKANDQRFQYTGRIDFSNPEAPRYWMPGVYVKAKFTGSKCFVLINDEMPDAKTHNYIEIVIDNLKPVRIQLSAKKNEIDAGKDLSLGEHTILICKNTEAGTGYIDFIGLKCAGLKKLPAKPVRKIEFIGNSITCGTGSDLSEIPCGKGVWQDQHNAYMSYGAATARNLNAAYHLTSVSGIGLMHSCCNIGIIMPQVFDKVNMRRDSIAWNFKNYQPDIVTICLGQNDGIQDSTTFCNNYVAFIKQVRAQYARASIVCLTSPMADEKLVMVMKQYLTAIVNAANNSGDKKVSKYFFSKRYHNGCDSHPDLEEHQQIAAELTAYLKELKNW